MQTITFEKMPQALQMMQASINELNQKLTEIQRSQPANEAPITGVELRKRLNISRPTESDMRKRGKLPYLHVNGQYRYIWQDVVKSLNHQ